VLIAGGVTALLALGACAANESDKDPQESTSGPESSQTEASLSGTLAGGGASSQTAAQEAWRAGFQSANPGATITYDPTGSGVGRTNFTEGGIAFVGTDAAFKTDDIAAGAFPACAAKSALVEVPAYISPIAVAFKLDGVDKLNLDAQTIAKIFRGEISHWNDPAIGGQNDGVELPDLAITPVHRSDKSGTTGNFTDYLHQAAAGAWPEEEAEEWPAELGGEAAEKTQGVREVITSTTGAIGYLDASQAADLGTVALKVGDQYVEYSAAAAAKAVSASSLEEGRADNDLVFKLNRTSTEQGVYPLILVSYLVACEKYADSATGELVSAFFTYVTSDEGQEAAARNAGSAPLGSDPSLAEKVIKAVAAIA
jgi:phosphate transport system substrate-binding protein